MLFSTHNVWHMSIQTSYVPSFVISGYRRRYFFYKDILATDYVLYAACEHTFTQSLSLTHMYTCRESHSLSRAHTHIYTRIHATAQVCAQTHTDKGHIHTHTPQMCTSCMKCFSFLYLMYVCTYSVFVCLTRRNVTFVKFIY